MPSAVKFEVYARIKDRWLLDSSVGVEQRQRAIDEAQQLDKRPDIGATKVIRETYDMSRERMKETTVFRSDRGASSSTDTISNAATQRYADEGPAIRRIQDNDVQQPAQPPTYIYARGSQMGSRFTALVFKIFLIGITSFAFATFTTWVVASA